MPSTNAPSAVTAVPKRDVKLCKHVAGRKGHLAQIGRVPGGEDDAPVVRPCAELVHHVRELVDALAGVVGARIDVLGPEVAPLEAVHRPEIAFFAPTQADAVQVCAAAVAVPDPDALGRERCGGGVAGNEPEELGDDGTEKDAFCGEEGEDERWFCR